MSILAHRLEGVRPSATKAMTAAAAELRAKGRSVITLSQGEPDFDTPEHVAEAGVAAIRNGLTRYTPVAGVTPLREAIVQKLDRENGLKYHADQVTVGCGAKQVLFNALLATLNPSDEVVIAAPCWVSYPDMVRLAGGVPIIVDCTAANGFKLTPDDFDAAITPRTKWLMLNSPSNPTGAVYTEDEYRALGEVFRRHPHIWLLADDIYEKLVYGNARFTTMPQVMPELIGRTLVVNGVSKSAAMTGWRVGYGAGPAHLIKAMNTIQGQSTSHTSSVSQYAAVAAISGDQSFLIPFLTEYEARRNLVVDLINRAAGLSCDVPDGAFYVFASCEHAIGKLTSRGQRIESDQDFALYLLQEAGVAVVAGSGFLASPYVRLSYASSREDLSNACNQIIEACSALR